MTLITRDREKEPDERKRTWDDEKTILVTSHEHQLAEEDKQQEPLKKTLTARQEEIKPLASRPKEELATGLQNKLAIASAKADQVDDLQSPINELQEKLQDSKDREAASNGSRRPRRLGRDRDGVTRQRTRRPSTFFNAVLGNALL